MGAQAPSVQQSTAAWYLLDSDFSRKESSYDSGPLGLGKSLRSAVETALNLLPPKTLCWPNAISTCLVAV
jgi:hypothetical protein